jgi:hypothetical protein
MPSVAVRRITPVDANRRDFRDAHATYRVFSATFTRKCTLKWLFYCGSEGTVAIGSLVASPPCPPIGTRTSRSPRSPLPFVVSFSLWHHKVRNPKTPMDDAHDKKQRFQERKRKCAIDRLFCSILPSDSLAFPL